MSGGLRGCNREGCALKTEHAGPAGDETATLVRVRGLVQGVGFRPFVWRLARDEGLGGHVLNDAEGVLAELRGETGAQDRFLQRLRAECPPLARIDEIVTTALKIPSDAASGDFRILASAGGAVATGVVPDAATCPDCLDEVFSSSNRRAGYAFTNCTHCGPRLSIIKAIPYDRETTSMAAFEMCPECRAEYRNPADRRFHAQPNACPVCGPHLWYEEAGRRVETEHPLDRAVARLAEGAIIAVKGIGGFHLAVDASRPGAVRTLRERKNRPHKPLALMARDLEQIRSHCEVSEAEADLLTSPAAPVVVLKRKAGSDLAEGLAPGQDHLGVMLPYSPLHHLLMSRMETPVVLTSGNLSEEPQAIGNEEARTRLARVADGFLMHDREIVNRLDDSVVRVCGTGTMMIRRARGLAPEPFALRGDFARSGPVLAMGAELKSTFALLRDSQAIVSQHLGDLEHRQALADLERNLDLYLRIHRFEPGCIAVDRHPDYISAQLGRRLAASMEVPLLEVQHHHAHMAACLAEHGVDPEDDQCLAIVLDGSGRGTDGMIWGGEFLAGGYGGFDRVGHFMPVPLPGGAAAIREPWRNLVAHLHSAFGGDVGSRLEGTEAGARLDTGKLSVVESMIEKRLNAPLSSSAGRLFDALAAAIGICFDRQTFEGQTGAALEALARPHLGSETAYPVAVTRGETVVLSWAPLWDAVLADLRSGVDPGRISARFHLGLIEAVAAIGADLAAARGVCRVVLSGGVMQNVVLLDALERTLTGKGYSVLVPRIFSANDGGISLGQAAVAAVTVPG